MLHQIALRLGPLPGRKNIYWFCGDTGGNIFGPNPTDLSDFTDLRPYFDELEAGRIAMYPIDARGLFDPGLFADAVWWQHVKMNNVAEATGGRAVYYRNFADQTTQHLIDTSNDFYTLSYSPRDFRYDNSWHKVKVILNGTSYNLSYRRGYFADGNDPQNKAEDTHTDKSRAKLLQDGETKEMKEVRGPSIVFEARVLPASRLLQTSGKKGTIQYTIRYTLPLDKFVMRNVDGKQQVTMGFASMAFDANGKSTAKLTQQVTATFSQQNLSVSGQHVYTFEQPINLKNGENYLYLGVWDASTGQFGTIQLSLDATHPKPGDKDVKD